MLARSGQLTPAQLSALAESTTESVRYVDLCLVLRRRLTGEDLLEVGGRWDRITRRYVGEPKRRHVFLVNESQLEVVAAFKEWLAARLEGRERRIILFAGGRRRGGKTIISVMCLAALCLALPGCTTWIVSATIDKREECDRAVRRYIPRAWRTYRASPEFRHTFLTGSSCKNISGEVPESVKRGGVECFLINDAQDMQKSVYSLGLPAIEDSGGLCIIASNPPQRQRGEWVNDVRAKIIEREIDGYYVEVDPTRNTSIHQETRGKVGAALRAVDPRAARADDEGLWLPVGDRAYDRFDRKRNVGGVPDLGDITAEVLKAKIGRAYSYLAGVDFQGTPHHAGVVLRVFGTPEAPIVYAVDEIITFGVEEEFLFDVDEKDRYDPATLVWIGDASGQWQDGSHTKGRQSYDIFKKFRWHIRPPVLKHTERGEFSRNPHIDDRLNLVNKMLDQGRLIVDPHFCPRLTEALRECPLKNINGRRKPTGQHSHITDALGYALFWLEPKPRGPVIMPSRETVRVVDIKPQGPRML